MKIGMLDPANLTPFYTYALSDGLANMGHELTYYSTQYDNDPGLRPPASVEFVDHYFKYFRKLQSNGPRKLRKAIRGISYLPGHRSLLDKLLKDKPNVVHIQWARLPILDLYFIRALQRAGIPVVLTVHDVDPFFSFGGDWLLRHLYNQVDHLIVHHSSAVAVLNDRFGVKDTTKISIIPHGPLQSENIPKDKTRDDARRVLEIPKSANVVTFFGEIKYYKGLDILIDAVVKAADNIPDLYLLMAGKPELLQDIPNTSILKDKNISHQANFSFIPNDEVWRYYLAANIVALPYRQISQSGVLFSALAHERFTVCSDVGGLPELIEMVGGGQIIPKESAEKLADTITMLFKEKDRLDLEAQKARIRLFDLCSWSRISRLTQNVYAKVTSLK
jgi:glycosyltransferase involved in cell wall biosynthesis